MGFVSSGMLVNACAEHPRYIVGFTGDGSFMTHPQIFIDAVYKRSTACLSSSTTAECVHLFATGRSVWRRLRHKRQRQCRLRGAG